MLSVNITVNTTEAYVKSSVVTEKAGTVGVLSTTVKATDNSGIIAVAGAVAVSTSNAIGAAIGYNEIDNDVLAYLDDVSLTTDGSLTLEATSNGEIGGVAVGVAVAIGSDGKLAGAGSILINKITNTIEAYVADTVTGTAVARHGLRGECGRRRQADREGRLADRLDRGRHLDLLQWQRDRGGDQLQPDLEHVKAYVEDATVVACGSAALIWLSVQSSSTLVAIALGVAGSGGNLAIGGSLTVNSIANTLDAHIKNSTNVSAGDDVRVTAFESATMVVVAGGIGVSTGGTAAGAAIAYNFIGGTFDDANPDLIDKDSTAVDQITAYIDNAKVTAGGDVEVRAGYEPPTTPLRTNVNVWTETVVTVGAHPVRPRPGGR